MVFVKESRQPLEKIKITFDIKFSETQITSNNWEKENLPDDKLCKISSF